MVYVADAARNVPHRLEAVIERVGWPWSHRANTAAAHSDRSC